MRHQLRNRPRRLVQRAHSKEQETVASQRRWPASVAQQARREEGENNEISTLDSAAVIQIDASCVDGSLMASDIRPADCAGSHWTENFRFVFGSGPGLGNGGALGGSGSTRAAPRGARGGAR